MGSNVVSESRFDGSGVSLGADLELHSRWLVDLIQEVVSSGVVASDALVLSAWRRYESFWLPLLGMYKPLDTKAPLAPPADVAMIWLAHLSTESYLQDISGICGAAGKSQAWTHPRGLAPQYRRHTPEDTVMISKTEAKWNKEFGKKEPWDAAASAANVASNATAVMGHRAKSKFKADIPAAVSRLMELAYQWLLPHWQKDWFVARAVLRYRRFLHLRKLYPGVLLIPPLDVELVILAHKACYLTFEHDMDVLFGTARSAPLAATPDPWSQTKALWQAAYGEEMELDGTGFRGPGPLGAPTGGPFAAATAASQLGDMGACWSFGIGRINNTGIKPPEFLPGSYHTFMLASMMGARSGPADLTVYVQHSAAGQGAPIVHVLGPDGRLLASARRVGFEALPTVHGLRGDTGLVLGPAKAAAFVVSGWAGDWGILVGEDTALRCVSRGSS